MLTNLKTILEIGEREGFAIPAFNVYNMESVIGVMEAAKETGAPIIFQMYSRLFDNRDAAFVAPLILEACKQLPTPACFHLDHGSTITQEMRAIRLGATGVMIDASAYPLEENIERTHQIVELAGACGVSVEGELGHVGTTRDEKVSDYTDVDEAVRYVKETGVAALAVMVGTAHGRYVKAPVLDIQRIKDIHEKTGVPLVLHGGSGVPDEQVRMAVEAGIRKMNFSTDLCYSFVDRIFETDRSNVAIDRFMIGPTDAIKNYAISKIRLLGAVRIK